MMKQGAGTSRSGPRGIDRKRENDARIGAEGVAERRCKGDRRTARALAQVVMS